MYISCKLYFGYICTAYAGSLTLGAIWLELRFWSDFAGALILIYGALLAAHTRFIIFSANWLEHKLLF